MAREILFKAKEKHDGDWIQGFLSMSEGEYVICGKDGVGLFIDPNTICQNTGLCDKNGNKIWENDVVQHDFGNGYGSGDGIGIQKAIIQYSKEYHSFLMKPINDWQYAHLQDCEVIGNIFDNPELLGGAENV